MRVRHRKPTPNTGECAEKVDARVQEKEEGKWASDLILGHGARDEEAKRRGAGCWPTGSPGRARGFVD